MKNAITFDEWREAIREAEISRADQIPQGWHTSYEIAESLGLSDSRTQAKITALVAEGVAEKRKFRIAEASGKLRSVPHYKLRSGGNGAKLGRNGRKPASARS